MNGLLRMDFKKNVWYGSVCELIECGQWTHDSQPSEEKNSTKLNPLKKPATNRAYREGMATPTSKKNAIIG